MKLYSDNCLQIIKSMDAQSVDCVITDPPFKGFDLRGTSQTYWYGFKKYFKEMERVSKHICMSTSANRYEYLFKKIKANDTLIINDAFVSDGIKTSQAIFMSTKECSGEDVKQLDETEDFSDFDYVVSPSIHPNARKVSKMALIVQELTNEGDTVLDPFCGSGAIGVACIFLKRNYIGIEMLPDRYIDAKRRLEEAERYMKDGTD